MRVFSLYFHLYAHMSVLSFLFFFFPFFSWNCEGFTGTHNFAFDVPGRPKAMSESPRGPREKNQCVVQGPSPSLPPPGGTLRLHTLPHVLDRGRNHASPGARRKERARQYEYVSAHPPHILIRDRKSRKVQD